MPTRLTQQDRDAVDLLLDKSTGQYAGKTVDPGHLRAAEKILHMLDAYEAGEEPSADLAARTMRLIDDQVAPVIRTTTMGAPIGNQPLA